jgi:hypothetical protein
MFVYKLIAIARDRVFGDDSGLYPVKGKGSFTVILMIITVHRDVIMRDWQCVNPLAYTAGCETV